MMSWERELPIEELIEKLDSLGEPIKIDPMKLTWFDILCLNLPISLRQQEKSTWDFEDL